MNAIYRLPLVAAVLAGAALVAQDSTGALVGTVKNQAGAHIEGARVGLSGGGLLTPRQAMTDANGNFTFRILPPGEYTVVISKSGYQGQRATLLRINPGQNTRYDFIIRELTIATEEIEVVGETAQAVDKTNSTTVSTFTAEQLRELPVGLSSTGALSLAPGVTNAGDYPAFRGAPGGGSQFLVNGISVRDNFLMYGRQTGFVIQDLTESIQVVQSPLNAKYGNTSGGTTNVITKSGTNEFSGSFRADIDRPDWYNWRGRPQMLRRFQFSNNSVSLQPTTSIYVDKNTIGLDDIWRQYQVTLLGPIIPNYVTFSYGRTWSPVTSSTVGIPNIMPGSSNNYGWYVTSLTDDTVPLSLGYQFGFTSPTQSYSFPMQGTKDVTQQFKLYYQISSAHQLEFYFTKNDLDALDTQYGGSEEDLGRRQKSDRRLLGLNYTGVIMGGVLELKYGQTKKQINWPTGPGDPINVVTWRNNYPEDSIQDYMYHNRANLLLNGSPGSPEAELRQNESYQVNYFWTNNTHNIDVGVERLKETGLVDLYNGPNNRYFYTQGYTADQRFMVYNWFNSPFMTDPVYKAGAGRDIFNALVASGSGLVPSYRVYDMTSDKDYHTYDTADAIYVNDLWNINDHWTVMGGLRFENWKIDTYAGTELDAKAISPRFEVKYDLRGDNRELFSLSYGHFRGTLGFGTLGGYGRRPSDVRSLYFWSQDMGHAAGEMYDVSRPQLLDTTNYQLFRTMNSNFANFISPNVKPEVGKQIEFSYRRAFADGGFVRGAFVHRRYDDNLYRRGTTTVLTDEMDKVNPDTQLENWLDIDPYNNRSYVGLELEWQLPLYRSAMSSVTASGGWTSARSKGRVTWGDERATTAIRFDDLYAQAGYNIDDYNAYGEYAAGRHNRFNLWVTWNYGRPGQVRSTLTVRGNYSTGAPSSITLTESLPGYGANAATTDTRPKYAPQTSNTPTSVARFLGNRGQFVGPDSHFFDLKWSLSIPIWKRFSIFTEMSIGNFLNDVLVTSYYGAQDTTAAAQLYRYTGDPAAPNPNYIPEYRMATGSADRSVYGRPSGWDYFRTYEFSAGFRF